MQDQWVELGRIGAPQGLKGWLRIQSFTDPPERLFEYRDWRLRGAGVAEHRTVAESRAQGRGWLVKLAGVDTRDSAQALAGAMVQVARSRLPALGAREHYRADLIGCLVRNLEGVELGRVSHFMDAPAGALMVVTGQRERWLPATPQHIRSVDDAAKTIVVDWPADF
jgi:16S rRNA processing protein RimM